MKLVIDADIPYMQGQAELLGECVYLRGTDITPADVADADILIVRTRTRCDATLLAGSRCKFVVTATIGYDHLDTTFLDKAGIAWASCPGCNAESVAQYVRCSLLRLSHDGHLRLGPDTRVGIIGAGHVGTAVAATLRHMGLHTLLCDPPLAEAGGTGFLPLSEICEQADIITFHTPLTHFGPHATHHLASAAFFRALKRCPLIINAARGGVVSETHLLCAISEGRVSGAVIDTWENEPHTNPQLLRQALIATPHIAGYSADGKANATTMALNAAARFVGSTVQFRIQPPPLPPGYTYSGHAAPCEDLRLYDPAADTQALRQSPDSFEHLRAHYPLRREHD